MPFTGSRTYSGNITVYCWDMTEDSRQLQQMCRSLGLDWQCDAKAESRRREIFAERLLLKEIFGNDASLMHNDDLAPFLRRIKQKISIAHARGRLCVAVGDATQCFGIDIETHRPRVLNVRDGFLNDNEKRWIEASDSLSHMIAWTAKEAVFKAISERSLIKEYRNQIVLSEFSLPAADEFTLTHRSRFIPKDEKPQREFTLISEINPHYIFTIATCGISERFA